MITHTNICHTVNVCLHVCGGVYVHCMKKKYYTIIFIFTFKNTHIYYKSTDYRKQVSYLPPTIQVWPYIHREGPLAYFTHLCFTWNNHVPSIMTGQASLTTEQLIKYKLHNTLCASLHMYVYIHTGAREKARLTRNICRSIQIWLKSPVTTNHT